MSFYWKRDIVFVNSFEPIEEDPMSKKKTIVVVGATGAQGGGLVRAILNDPDGPFRARALTRNAHSALVDRR